MASNLPHYVASAQPVPLANRVPWYKSTAQTYAGIMLWFVFWESVPSQWSTGSGRDPRPRLGDGAAGRDRGGVDLPLRQLPGPRPDGHEDGSAAGRGGHVDLRRAGRVPDARLLHGRPAVRLVGGQRLLLRQAPGVAAPGVPGRIRPLHLGIGVVWAIVAAFVGLKGIQYVAKVATYLPLIPLVILLILAGKTLSGVGNFKPEMLAGGAEAVGLSSLDVFLFAVANIVGFFATAGAAGVDIASSNRDSKDVQLGGLGGRGRGDDLHRLPGPADRGRSLWQLG